MFLQEKIADINKRLLELNNVNNIILWGAGVHTCKLFEKTELFSYPIKNIVDIDKKKQGNDYFGFRIEDPEKIDWKDIQGVIISVPGKEQEIRKKLVDDFKYRKTIITLYEGNETTPFYKLYDRNISQIYYLGDYQNWSEASDGCKGYNDNVILNKVIQSVQKVLHGDAVWERDSYLFYEKQYVYPICAAILKCAVQNKNQGVRILDIGGSLGSTYYQNKDYLSDIKHLEYIIAEQDSFADYGKRNLENETLQFISSTDDFNRLGKVDIVLMSASLQYIYPNRKIIEKIRELKPSYIILDRIAVSNRTRICKEIVPEEIYKSSYPMMIYSEYEIINLFYPVYKIVEKNRASVQEEAYFIDGKADWMYYVFQKVSEDS